MIHSGCEDGARPAAGAAGQIPRYHLTYRTLLHRMQDGAGRSLTAVTGLPVRFYWRQGPRRAELVSLGSTIEAACAFFRKLTGDSRVNADRKSLPEQ